MIVHRVRDRALLVIPIRVVLGLLWLAAARIAGAERGPALLAFVIGLLGILIAIFNDPRRRFAQGKVEPLELPPEAVLAPAWRQALAAMLPSTVGVSALAAIAVVPQPTLAALLGGVCAGLGVATLLSLSRVDPTLYVDPRSHVFYRR